MKKLLTTILFGVLLTLPLFGQATNTKNGSQPPLSGDHGPMDNLPQPEREKLKAAHDLALQKDPSLDDKIKAAHEAPIESIVPLLMDYELCLGSVRTTMTDIHVGHPATCPSLVLSEGPKPVTQEKSDAH